MPTLVVEGGVSYNEDTGLAIGEPPSLHHIYDWTQGAWGDPRTIEQIKLSKWSALKSARDTAEFGGFTWDGSTFDSDPQSQSRIQGAAQLATLATMAGQAFSVDWTLANNSVRALSGADMLAVGEAMGMHIMAVHETGRLLRAALEAATTETTVAAVNWPTT